MKKIILVLALSICIGGAFAQKKKSTTARVTGLDVTYGSPMRSGSDKDAKDKKKSEPRAILQMKIRGGQVAISPINNSDRKIDARRKEMMPPVSMDYIDIDAGKRFVSATLHSGEVVTSEIPLKDAQFSLVDSAVVAGWNCKHVRTSVNSNSIDIWYTEDAGFRGSPIPAWGLPNGVVLKVARNGNTMIEALSANQVTDKEVLLPTSWGRMIDEAEFNDELRQSVVKTVEVFSNDRIGFVGGNAPEGFKDGQLYAVGGGTVIMKKVALPKSVEDYSIFAEVVQYSDGDAYDRTGSIFVIPTDKKQSFLDALSTKGLNSLPSFESDSVNYPGLISTVNYDVPVELMRFFTTFGVRKFNHIKVKGQVWADSVLYKQDVTHLAPMLKDSAWVAAYIGNWDAKGHILSLKLKYYPSGRGKDNNQVIPLFNTLNILEQAGQTYPVFFDKDSLRMNFTLTREVKDAKLVYITTGHGGWGGGDEFNQKLNTIWFDGVKVFSFVPWREDCATYRNWNPCSGNFSNGLSSSDLSRSNWCPGTVTYPVYVPLGNLSEGEHSISVQIPLGKSEGSSFSYWCISAVLVGE